ncbi:MAG: hypothetical protein QMC90_04555 [Dehalococcoidales bacterium]|nr:hypothetical protein [Dehalococcoidales bacterium]
METAQLEIVIPTLKPQFLRDLLEILGQPSSTRFIISSKEISQVGLKIGQEVGVRLEDRYIAGAPVEFDGEASIEQVIEIYEQWFPYQEMIEKGKVSQHELKTEAPKVIVKEIRWHDRSYSIKFDRHRVEIDIAADKEEIIGRLIQCAKKHEMRIRMSFP